MRSFNHSSQCIRDSSFLQYIFQWSIQTSVANSSFNNLVEHKFHERQHPSKPYAQSCRVRTPAFGWARLILHRVSAAFSAFPGEMSRKSSRFLVHRTLLYLARVRMCVHVYIRGSCNSHISGAYRRLQRVQQTAQCATTAGTPFSCVARYVAWFAYIPGVVDSLESPLFFLFLSLLFYRTRELLDDGSFTCCGKHAPLAFVETNKWTYLKYDGGEAFRVDRDSTWLLLFLSGTKPGASRFAFQHWHYRANQRDGFK